MKKMKAPLMFRNHPELFYDYYFKLGGTRRKNLRNQYEEHVKNNKSFYKILEELNE